MDIILIVMGVLGYGFIGLIFASVIDAWNHDDAILFICFWPIMFLIMIIFGIMSFAIFIGEQIRKIFITNPNICDGCDNSWMTKGISCDSCRNQSNYHKANEEELRNFYKDIYKEKGEKK